MFKNKKNFNFECKPIFIQEFDYKYFLKTNDLYFIYPYFRSC